MTLFNCRTALFAAAMVVSASAAAPAMAGETIKLTTQEWKPYQTVVNGQVEGIAVKAVKCAIEKTGNKADFVVLPWARAQKDVADGAAQGFFAASKSPERDSFAEMSAPFIPQNWKWYVPADKAVDPANKASKVGVLAGSAMEKWLDENGYGATQKIQASDALVKMLQTGRIDAVLANDLVFKESLTATGTPLTAFKEVSHSERPLGVYFSKAFLASHPGFLDTFNAQAKSCQ